MNTYFSQVEKRPQFFSYLLAVFAICTVTMLILNFSHFFENSWTIPSASSEVVHSESTSMLVAIPAPRPPEEQIQMSITSLPSGGANPVPQAVPISAPSVP